MIFLLITVPLSYFKDNYKRNLTYFLAFLYTLLGAVLFVAPGWAAANFAWKVSPFVASLVVLGVTARPGSFLTQGAIFPEELTLFTIHAFAAFYFSLVAAAVSLINTRGMALVIYFIRFGIALILPITAAAFINLDKFDFVNRPGGILYIGAYIAALLIALFILAAHRLRRPVLERTA